jgi:hypothetical protein
MRKMLSLALSAAVATIAFAAPADAEVIGTTEGCTPGYWKVKQHHDSWQEAKPGTPFVEAFRQTSDRSSAGMEPVGAITSKVTMLQALNFKGGSSVQGAQQILARAAVAAYLNASYDSVDGEHLQFPWRRWNTGAEGRPALVPTVVSALSSGNRSKMLDLATRLDRDNNLGCPLN